MALSGTLAGQGTPTNARSITLTSNTTLGPADIGTVVLADTSGGSFTITLPATDSIGAGATFLVVASTGASNPVSIALAGGDTFNGGQAGPVILTADNAFSTWVNNGIDGYTGFISLDGTAFGSGGATFVYREGGVQEGNVFTSLEAALTAAAMLEGPKILEVDDSLGTPIAPDIGVAYDFNDVSIRGPLGPPGFPTLTFQDGATAVSIRSLFKIRLASESTSSIETLLVDSIIRLNGNAVLDSDMISFFDVVSGAAEVFLTNGENQLANNCFTIAAP